VRLARIFRLDAGAASRPARQAAPRPAARLWIACALLVALLAPAFAQGQSGGGELLLTESPNSGFPDKEFVLETPTARRLTADQVTIVENGSEVIGVTVAPPGSQSGAILLVDASNSMEGAPIQGAMNAARAFLAERRPSLPVAVVAFNHGQTTLAEFTTDGAALSAALQATPPLAEGTGIYDALVQAADLARQQGLERVSVVLLSDGADVGSEAGRAAAIQALTGAKARVIAVGLRSPQYDPATLRSLALRTEGTYVETASPGKLSAIFADIGGQLSKEYVVTYRSLLRPEVEATVKVSVAGAGAATASYTTPALDLDPRGSFDRTWVDRVILSPWLMVFVVGSVLALLAFAGLTAIDVRNRSLRRRMAMYVSVPSEEESSLRRAEVAALLAEQAQKRFGGTTWWQGFERDVELAGFRVSAMTLAGWTLLGAVLASLLAAFALQSLLGLLVGLVAPVVTKALVGIRLSRVRAAFEEQLPDNVDVLAGALRAGHSLVGAMSVMMEDAQEPSRSEYRRVLQDEQLGVPVDQALMVMAQRMASRDTEQIALVTRLQREAGGNTAEVLDRVVDNIRARMEIRRLIRVLTAQGRMAQGVLTALPLVLTGAILLLNPGYLDPLFSTSVGRAFLVAWFVMLVAGYYALKKVVEIEF
jgi:tight adherence protein B